MDESTLSIGCVCCHCSCDGISCVHDFNFVVDEILHLDVNVWKVCC